MEWLNVTVGCQLPQNRGDYIINYEDTNVSFENRRSSNLFRLTSSSLTVELKVVLFP